MPAKFSFHHAHNFLVESIVYNETGDESMLTCDATETWTQFLEYVKKRCSQTAFENWLAPIEATQSADGKFCLIVPNIFVKAYLLDNYKKDLSAFVPVDSEGEPVIHFEIIAPLIEVPSPEKAKQQMVVQEPTSDMANYELKLNQFYQFDNFIEGPSNQFVKSAAMGIANR